MTGEQLGVLAGLPITEKIDLDEVTNCDHGKQDHKAGKSFLTSVKTRD